MKGFASGVGGVCVCVLAIMGTVLCGFVLGVDETTSTTTQYSQVADTTGLFTTSSIPAFTDYDPAANWTGYRQEGKTGLAGVDYTASAKINSYPIPSEATQTAATVSYFTGTSDYADPPGTSLLTAGVDLVLITDDVVRMTEQVNYISNPRVSTIAQQLETWTLQTSTTLIVQKLTFGSSGLRVYAAPSSWWSHEAVLTNPGGTPAHYADYMILPYTQTAEVVTLSINTVDDIVIGMDADGNEKWRSTTANTTLAYLQATTEVKKYPKTDWGGDVGEPYTQANRTEYKAGTVAYMDVSQGVTPTTSDKSTTWTNGYDNGKIDMLIRWNPSATKSVLWMYQTIKFTESSGSWQEMTLYIEITYWYKHWGDNSIMITTSDMSESVGKNTKIAYLGNFAKGIYLSMDMTADTLAVYGLDTFRSFQDYSTLTTPALSYPDFYTTTAGRTLQTMEGGITCPTMILGTQDPSTTAPTIGVVETSVYLGDSALVMAYPTIQPGLIWPGTDPWELRIYSFAYYGSDIAIKDSTGTLASFEVDAGKISVDGEAHTLSNLYIRSVWDPTASDWDVYLVFGDERDAAVQVATSTDTAGPILAFGGYWYFISSYYTGQDVRTTDYSVDFQEFIFDDNAAILCFMGLLILGAIVAKRMAGLGIYDMIILLFAGVCGFVLMVV